MEAEFDAAFVMAAFDGDIEDIRELVELVSRSLPQYLADLRDAVQHADRPRVAALAHTIRGAVGNVGAQRLARLSRQIEMSARDGAPVGVAGLEPVEGAARDLVAALAMWVAALGHRAHV